MNTLSLSRTIGKASIALLVGLGVSMMSFADERNAPNNVNNASSYGPGMMGEFDGSYMGPGMMGFGMPGRGMMGGGMMGGYGCGPGNGSVMGGLDLTRDQRSRINAIVDQTRKSHWTLMGKMLDQQASLRDLYNAPTRDQAAIDKGYKTLRDLRQQMYTTSVDARKRIEAVLTPGQRDKLREDWRESGPMVW
ncbi:Spy/CpxP family protein refolding chaperone [Paraburkholderia sacchari]|uniref:Spy/CpxP family protein refolding chaperone n=1 Tax=Paraburkholderia sacchari TaxID=159450 RepID=UPI001FD4FD1F|nr:Spy/CpxP family protein refolding chaperone [Paraburkholderia sacchari]